MLPPAAAQAPVMMASRRGWSGDRTVSSVTPRKRSVSQVVATVRPPSSEARDEAGVLDAPRLLDLEPVGRVVARRIGVEVAVRPVGKFAAQALLGEAHPVGAGDIGGAAAEHDLGLVVERAQELALPARPDAGPDRLDVGDGEDEQELQPLHRLDDRGESS